MFGWLKGHRIERARGERVTDPATCVHSALVPHWDAAADIGHNDRVAFFRCDTCHSNFTPAEGAALRTSEAQRIRT